MRLKKWVQFTLIVLLYVLVAIMTILSILGSQGLVYPIIYLAICFLIGLIINVLIRKSDLF